MRNPLIDEDPADICKCGDRRSEHPNNGPCALNGLSHGLSGDARNDCFIFRLAISLAPPMRNQGEGPANAAWEKYKTSELRYATTSRAIFIAGWNAALDWIPVRIAQLREMEEDLRKEVEELKKDANTQR